MNEGIQAIAPKAEQGIEAASTVGKTVADAAYGAAEDGISAAWTDREAIAAKAQEGVQAASTVGKTVADAAYGAAEDGISAAWTDREAIAAKAQEGVQAASTVGKTVADAAYGAAEDGISAAWTDREAIAAKAQEGVQAASTVGKTVADAAYGAAEDGISAAWTQAEAIGGAVSAEVEKGVAAEWTGIKALPAKAWAASGLTKLAVGIGVAVVIGLVAAASAGVFGGSAPGGQSDKAALLPSQTTTTQLSQSQTPTTQKSESLTTANTTQQTAAASGSGSSDTWLLWDWSSRTAKPPYSWNPTWHVVLKGDSESGTVTIPEDKTVTATYQANGDKLTIDITRILGPINPEPQKFHYEFTGYPNDYWTGTILIGRIGNDTSVTAWSEPREARATRGLNTPPKGTPLSSTSTAPSP